VITADVSPVVANPLADVTVDEDADDSVIDLSNLFDDVDNDNAAITKAAVSSNTSLVTAEVSGNTLTLNYQANQNGAATITVTASSNGQTVTDSFTVTVNPKSTITVTASPTNGGTSEGEGTYDDGSTVNLSATAAHGFIFSHWSGVSLADPNATSISLAVTEDIALNAHFTVHADSGQLDYELNATEHDADWKESHWFGFFHQVHDHWIYHFGFGWIYVDQVTDKAFWYWQDDHGWLWTNHDVFPAAWSNDTNGWICFYKDPTTGNLLTDSKGRLGYFDYSISQWTVTSSSYEVSASASPSNGGTVSGAGSHEKGDTVTLTATPASGFEFTGWSGDASGSSSTITLTADGDKSVTATFKAISAESVIDSLFR